MQIGFDQHILATAAESVLVVGLNRHKIKLIERLNISVKEKMRLNEQEVPQRDKHRTKKCTLYYLNLSSEFFWKQKIELLPEHIVAVVVAAAVDAGLDQSAPTSLACV